VFEQVTNVSRQVCVVGLIVDKRSNPVEEGPFEGMCRASYRFFVHFIGLYSLTIAEYDT
jgi:hypothetical protein